MELADRIRTRMNELKLTQEALAERVGISQAMVYKLLSRKAKSTTKLIELAEALECGVEWLASGKSNKQYVYEESGEYTYASKLPVSELVRQIKALPKKQQKKIALNILDQLVSN